jgi:hypothetical protein
MLLPCRQTRADSTCHRRSCTNCKGKHANAPKRCPIENWVSASRLPPAGNFNRPALDRSGDRRCPPSRRWPVAWFHRWNRQRLSDGTAGVFSDTSRLLSLLDAHLRTILCAARGLRPRRFSAAVPIPKQKNTGSSPRFRCFVSRLLHVHTRPTRTGKRNPYFDLRTGATQELNV